MIKDKSFSLGKLIDSNYGQSTDNNIIFNTNIESISCDYNSYHYNSILFNTNTESINSSNYYNYNHYFFY